jgi:hypothetical protein
MSDPLTIECTHPRTSERFVAEVLPQATGNQVVLGLVNAGFLETAPPGRPYKSVVDRTGKEIAPNMTLEAAQVQDGDVLAILQPGQGA